MDIFFAQILNGLMIGFLYSIVVIGYNLVVIVTGILHWAYAHLLVLSMCIAWLILKLTGDNVALAISGAIVAGIIISTITGPVFLPFIRRRSSFEGFVVSMGIAIIAVEIFSHWINLGLTIAFPPVIRGTQSVIKLGLYTFSIGDMVTLFGSITILFAFFYFLYRTKRGRILRAVAEDPNVATALGISVTKTAIFSFALAGALAGLTAVFLAISVGAAAPKLGDNIAVKCLAILLFASVGSLRGGVICAILFGVIETLVIGYLPGQWENAIAFTIVVGVLLFKPEGVFGVKY